SAHIDVVVDPLGDLGQTGACGRLVGRACLVLWSPGCPPGAFRCAHRCATSAGTKAGATRESCFAVRCGARETIRSIAASTAAFDSGARRASRSATRTR